MIVVDSSALLAIYLDEPEKASFADTITMESDTRIGAPNFLEASMIAETRHGKTGCSDLDELLEALGLAVVAFDPDHIEAARDAFRRYGKAVIVPI